MLQQLAAAVVADCWQRIRQGSINDPCRTRHKGSKDSGIYLKTTAAVSSRAHPLYGAELTEIHERRNSGCNVVMACQWRFEIGSMDIDQLHAFFV